MPRSRPLSRTSSLAALALVTGMALTACGGSEQTIAVTGQPKGDGAPHRIPEVLQRDEAGRFTTLLNCVQLAGLGSALEGTGPMTLFAPTNAAFSAAGVRCEPDAELDKAQLETLTRTLLQHVVGEDVAFEEPEGFDPEKPTRGLVIIESSKTVDSLLTDSASTGLLVDPAAKTVRRLGDSKSARILGEEIIAPNGYIHVIDAVLAPPAKDAVPPTTALPKPFSS